MEIAGLRQTADLTELSCGGSFRMPGTLRDLVLFKNICIQTSSGSKATFPQKWFRQKAVDQILGRRHSRPPPEAWVATQLCRPATEATVRP